MEISPPCDRSVTIITLIPLICASRITQNTTCPTCRTPFVTPPPGGEERVGEEQLSDVVHGQTGLLHRIRYRHRLEVSAVEDFASLTINERVVRG